MLNTHLLGSAPFAEVPIHHHKEAAAWKHQLQRVNPQCAHLIHNKVNNGHTHAVLLYDPEDPKDQAAIANINIHNYWDQEALAELNKITNYWQRKALVK